MSTDKFHIIDQQDGHDLESSMLARKGYGDILAKRNRTEHCIDTVSMYKKANRGATLGTIAGGSVGAIGGAELAGAFTDSATIKLLSALGGGIGGAVLGSHVGKELDNSDLNGVSAFNENAKGYTAGALGLTGAALGWGTSKYLLGNKGPASNALGAVLGGTAGALLGYNIAEDTTDYDKRKARLENTAKKSLLLRQGTRKGSRTGIFRLGSGKDTVIYEDIIPKDAGGANVAAEIDMNSGKVVLRDDEGFAANGDVYVRKGSRIAAPGDTNYTEFVDKKGNPIPGYIKGNDNAIYKAGAVVARRIEDDGNIVWWDNLQSNAPFLALKAAVSGGDVNKYVSDPAVAKQIQEYAEQIKNNGGYSEDEAIAALIELYSRSGDPKYSTLPWDKTIMPLSELPPETQKYVRYLYGMGFKPNTIPLNKEYWADRPMTFTEHLYNNANSSVLDYLLDFYEWDMRRNKLIPYQIHLRNGLTKFFGGR